MEEFWDVGPIPAMSDDPIVSQRTSTDASSILGPTQRRIAGFALTLLAILGSIALLIGTLIVLGQSISFFSSVLWPLATAAVIALIVRAVHRIGAHVLLDRWLWTIAIACVLGHLAGVHFAWLLLGGGLAYVLAKRSPLASAGFMFVAVIATIAWYSARPGGALVIARDPESVVAGATSVAVLFWSGLKAGLLTFGGAYTAIPLVQRDAVSSGAWMSNAQFMDGIAIGGLLPAPLIIFTTFVGYVGGGALGAIVMTFATFLPAFALTLVAHEPMERLIHRTSIRTFLDGVTAAVVGLIAGTGISFLVTGIRSVTAALVFGLALSALFYWKGKWAIPVVIAAAALVGFVALSMPR